MHHSHIQGVENDLGDVDRREIQNHAFQEDGFVWMIEVGLKGCCGVGCCCCSNFDVDRMEKVKA